MSDLSGLNEELPKRKTKKTYYERKSGPRAGQKQATDYKPNGLFFQQEEKIRTCLKCRKEFTSHGDRICPPCTFENQNESKRAQANKKPFKTLRSGSRESNGFGY